MSKSVKPKSEDYARWYTDVITKSEMADYGPVIGSMVIRPYGFSIWDSIKNEFDASNAVHEVRVAGIEKDGRPPRLVYQPGHPDADPESGMVEFPNVSVHEEMADLISSSRATEANLAIIRTARQMAMQTLAIGKG